MMLHIPDVLTTDEVESLRRALANQQFVDGKLTAGSAAEKVKNNLEMERDSRNYQTMAQAIGGCLYRSETFRNAALPNRLASPIFARYVEGMTYGFHIDDPIMGSEGQRYRTDISCTVFLSDPDDYEGGELVIKTAFGDQRVKGKAGDAVIYPSGSIHQVAPVTQGERLVSVLWIQSLVRDPDKRAVLWDLCQARDKLLAEAPGEETTDQVDHAYINLLRMWSEL